MGLNRKTFETGKFSRFRTDFPIQFWKPEENKVEPLTILLEEIADSEEHKKILYDLLTKESIEFLTQSFRLGKNTRDSSRNILIEHGG